MVNIGIIAKCDVIIICCILIIIGILEVKSISAHIKKAAIFPDHVISYDASLRTLLLQRVRVQLLQIFGQDVSVRSEPLEDILLLFDLLLIWQWSMNRVFEIL